MRKLFILLAMLLILYVIGMTAFASEISMTVSGNTVTAHNTPKDSTLFTVSYKDGKISSVSAVKGEGTINADITYQRMNSDTVKAFLWDLKTLKPLTESKTVTKSKTLVVCFSATGHTKPLAEYAAEYLGADFYEIVPEEPYTAADLNYNDSNSRATREQNDSSARPKISGDALNMADYDTVIIAHPIWWGQAPKIIYTFLESYDFSGKTITTICTSGSSPLGSSADDLKALKDDSATWLESRRFSIGASENEVKEWLDRIGIKAENNDAEPKEKELIIKVNGQTIPVIWENNESVTELKKQAEQHPIIVSMSKYGGFEQVGSLGKIYPSNDTRITTQNGDIVLYSSNQIVMFYGSNTWAYTRLGRINLSDDEVTKLLENDNVTLTININNDCAIPDKKLNSGYSMPVLGLGTWTQDDETAADSVYCALKDGYRLIDTAQYYGNEAGVGEGVRRAIDEGIVKREDVFVTSKVMPMNYNSAYSSIKQSNEKIGLGYIDLMLIHQSGSNDKQVYRALEQSVKDGTVHSIGISNYYNKADFDRITEGAEIMPAIVQNENHPFYQNTEFQEYVKQYGTVVESYYPLGGRGHTRDILGNETINEIAKVHNKTAAQIVLRWHVQEGYITIPGSSDPDHISENIDIFDFELTDGEIQKIKSLDTGTRYENW